MSEKRRWLLAVSLLGLGMGCIIVPARRGVYVPPPPRGHSARPVPAPPPAGRYLSEGEAVNIGLRYCQNHGLRCSLQNAHLTGDGVWKVKFRVHGWEKGHVFLDLDARNGSILKVNEKVRER